MVANINIKVIRYLLKGRLMNFGGLPFFTGRWFPDKKNPNTWKGTRMQPDKLILQVCP